MSTCSLENCEYECFEQENKCILHCEKDDWYEIKDNKKDWSKSIEKVKLFWKEIRNIIFNSQQKLSKFLPISFNNIIFPKFEGNGLSSNVLDYEDSFFIKKGEKKFTQSVNFNNCTFLDCVDFTNIHFEKDIVFSKCTLKDEIKFKRQQNIRISFLNCPEIKSLDFSKIVFEQKVEIKECVINSCNFENTRFKKVCDFYKTEFYSNLFFKTTFEDIAVFTEAVFHNDVNFEFTTFEKLALFRKTKFHTKVNFEDSIFKEEANFLDIDAGMANRETARIIKNSFEQQNNIIEANRFYALEMQEREKELTKDILKGESISEWLIFKIHSLSSDHSQSWFLALLWIIIATVIYSTLSASTMSFDKNIFTATIVFGVLSFCAIACSEKNKYKKHITSFVILGLLLVNYLVIVKSPLECFSKNINPFGSIGVDISFGLLLFKVIIAYLIYQFIISVRQNTRRK